MAANSLSAEQVIEALGLEPHPEEGGFFREIYRSEETLPSTLFAGRYQGERSVGTAIYYLLTPSTFSEMHRLSSDEIFHFYFGDPVQQLRLETSKRGEIVTLGSDLNAGHQPQSVVPRGVWQGARLMPGGDCGFALLGTTVAPGFDFADYERGQRQELSRSWPAFEDEINRLTHI